ncbi:putative hemolysin [Acinetobacter rudis]|uniref:DUF333 domain-containing protein n=1 Tax=Acinetobacter rudis TaxID=632955 RepID=A0AAW8J558_9GAMM|nr:DUF333 domain-containing protein [Acinetobacter rudis]MDQ8934774.1 DUF333 domain-containing protein [Acinetobacter rudis]MDQ8951438.1 DUF333 domain-containing protein [Acinetobacter rudis]MDQ9017145.1 DUF333 domain-containing protein [Acinetobacter rudis]
MIRKLLISTSLISLISLSACANHQSKPENVKIGMANPASVYCQNIGGKLSIQKEKDGDVGYCELSDGQVIEEWKLYRQHHSE